MKFSQSMVLLIGAIVLTACKADEKSVMSADKREVVAMVNGKAISKDSYELFAKLAGAPANNPDAKKALIEQIAIQMLAADEAVKKGLDKRSQVQDQMEALKRSVLSNAYVQDYLDSHPVSDDTVKAEYDKLKKDMAGLEYKARHILVDNEAEAKDIIALLKKNAGDFDRLARDKSIDHGSSAQGGDLGWFDLTKMVPEFGDAVHGLQKGQFTPTPVKTQYGYHVIMLDDTRPIQPPEFEAVKAELTQQIKQQEVQKHINELKAKVKIEITPTASTAPKK